ncbi:hypothetical protein [Microbispora sp. NPDC049125]|uniref:hypothetical protein n=1 Tax=Microbispora sp. NPDC049125 TaxID=3154929 RepID=UPI00346635C9
MTQFNRGDLVTHEGRPYIVIRVDSVDMAEIHHGNTLDGLKSKDRGNWVRINSLTKRTLESATLEEQALNAIWEHFQGGDWGNALRVITQYGHDRYKAGHSAREGRSQARSE